MKYVLLPGWVTSRYDGDRHFIGAGRLMHLYNVEPRLCVTVAPNDKDRWPEEWPRLRPSYSGHYRAPPLRNTP